DAFKRRGSGRKLMADRTGLEKPAHADGRRQDRAICANVDGISGNGISGEVGNRVRGRVETQRPIIVRSERSEGRDLLRQIDLSPDNAEQILVLHVVPGLPLVHAGVRCPGQRDTRTETKIGRQPTDILVLVSEVGRHAYVLTAEVETENSQSALIRVV